MTTLRRRNALTYSFYREQLDYDRRIARADRLRRVQAYLTLRKLRPSNHR